MTAQNKKEEHKKVEETLGVKDDSQVVLDGRGFYKIGDQWWVKIARINVRQMISAWGVIAQAFVNVQGMKLDFDQAGTWITLFLTALPHFPGKFYQFIMTLCELQNVTEESDEVFFGKERDNFAKYIRRNLQTEEIIDIIQVTYDQEKDRFVELIKKARPLLEPMMKMWQAEQEKTQAEQAEKAMKDLKLMKDLATGPKSST